ncbi:hypothetical protein BHE74_00039758 [Ensete ventricosum]|nr:hypothetical protein BHE74_00039758 [Ensete ventricosum]
MIELVEESEHEGEDLEYDEEDMEEEPQPADCTVHALAGYANLRMMKIGGFLKQQPVTVLIDIGSTNNFVNNKVVVDALSRLPDKVLAIEAIPDPVAIGVATTDDGSAVEGDDGGVGDRVSNCGNYLDDGGWLKGSEALRSHL